MEFILFNDKIVPETEFNPVALWIEPAFTISREMWFSNGTILFYDEHFREIKEIVNYFERVFTPDFPSPQELYRILTRLINKNKAFMGGWVRLKIGFREDKTILVADVIRHPQRSLPICDAGKMAILSPIVKFSGHYLNKYSFFSENLWAAESFRISGNSHEIPVLTNQRGMVTEALSSNLFAIYKNKLYTPAPETGCYLDRLRERILLSAEFNGFQINESGNMTWASLLDMEEIFTASEKEGLKWIKGIDTTRFVRTRTELIWRRLNKILDSREEG